MPSSGGSLTARIFDPVPHSSRRSRLSCHRLRLFAIAVATTLFVAAEPSASAQENEPDVQKKPQPQDPADKNEQQEPKDKPPEKKEEEKKEDAQQPPKKKKHRIETVPFRDAAPPSSSFLPKRPVPDYDGRGDEPTTAADVLLWVPRILVAPFYLFSEFVIRRPIVALITGIEYDRLAQKAFYIFSFGGKQKLGIVPTAFLDFGFLPSVGFYFFWDDALHPKNHVRVHFGTWGTDWLNVAVTDRWDLGEKSTVAMRASFVKRSDRLFYGLGPDAPDANESRYESTILDAGPMFDLSLAPGARVVTTTGIRKGIFGQNACCSSPSTYERVTRGDFAAPPRFFDGYTMGYQSAQLVLDSRDKKANTLTGVRLASSAQPAFDLSHRPGNSWINYEATAGGFWDITGSARVLSLTVAAMFSDPIRGSGSDIPFNEQVVFGGEGWMRGYLAGRLVGRSGAVATLNYEYPVWAFLNGTLQVSTGNVFGPGLAGIEPKKLRLSTGFGLRTNSSPDNQFELLMGFGTETFEQGAAISSIRLALGATRGF